MEQKKALIGMSGGVDSSVAAWLMLRQGCDCTGATMQLHNFRCGGEQDAHDAAQVAQRLGIEHRILEYQPEFEKNVIAQFVSA